MKPWQCQDSASICLHPVLKLDDLLGSGWIDPAISGNSSGSQALYSSSATSKVRNMLSAWYQVLGYHSFSQTHSFSDGGQSPAYIRQQTKIERTEYNFFLAILGQLTWLKADVPSSLRMSKETHTQMPNTHLHAYVYIFNNFRNFPFPFVYIYCILYFYYYYFVIDSEVIIQFIIM